MLPRREINTDTLRSALDAIRTEAARVVGHTENGAVSNATSGSDVLNFFAHAGAVRNAGDPLDRVTELFERAYTENPDLAVAAAFQLRDIRGGQGEREAFRLILLWLADNHPYVFKLILHLIPEYGRWDDLLMFIGHKSARDPVIQFVTAQWTQDLRSIGPVSLLAKWMPSENASSYETKLLARAWIRALGLSQRRYRHYLSVLRAKIEVAERNMSAGQWGNIEYSHVPSQAMRIYRNAFRRHDPERFREWLSRVQRGEARINAATLFPHEILRSLNTIRPESEQNELLEAQWNALPNYFEGLENPNVLVVADTSGSMRGDPMLVAIGLALYAAERNVGQFHNTYIHFAEDPVYATVLDGRLAARYAAAMHPGHSGYNTNIQRVFNLILGTALRHNVSQDQMPSVVFIISDMQFDQASGITRPPHVDTRRRWEPNEPTNFEAIRQQYADAGYTMPRLVFWNVRSVATDSPVTMDENGTMLVSGLSPVIFRQAITAQAQTPYEAMLEILNSDRYTQVREALRG